MGAMAGLAYPTVVYGDVYLGREEFRGEVGVFLGAIAKNRA
jgi:hypothetical protein